MNIYVTFWDTKAEKYVYYVLSPLPHIARLSVISMRPVAREQTNVAIRDANRVVFFFLKAPVNVRTFPLDADRHGVTPDSVLFCAPPPPVDCLASDSVHTEVSGLLRNVKMIPR